MRFSDRTPSHAIFVAVVLSAVTMIFLNVAEVIGHGFLEPLI